MERSLLQYLSVAFFFVFLVCLFDFSCAIPFYNDLMKISQQVVEKQFVTRIQFFFLYSELSLEVIQTFRRFIVSACFINVIKILPAKMTARVSSRRR